jgi:hypothetical protein
MCCYGTIVKTISRCAKRCASSAPLDQIPAIIWSSSRMRRQTENKPHDMGVFLL